MKAEFKKWLSKKLINLRNQHGKEQLEVSQAIGKNKPAYAAYEAGMAEPSLLTVLSLCKFYSLTLNDFFSDVPTEMC